MLNTLPYSSGIPTDNYSVLTSRPVRFDGTFSLTVKNRGRNQKRYCDYSKRVTIQNTYSILNQAHSQYQIVFRANASDGLLLWESSGMTLFGDYLLIALKDGFVNVAYNLGKGSTLNITRSTEFVADLQEHTVTFMR